jgi:hypothetical protein
MRAGRCCSESGSVTSRLLAQLAGFLIAVVVVIAVIKYSMGRHLIVGHPSPAAPSPPAQSQNTPAPEIPQQVAVPALALNELTKADWPDSVTLLNATQIPFKKGSHFVAKDTTPLFFYGQYWSDAKAGDEFEILDYDPEAERVYLSSTNSGGDTIVQLLKVAGGAAMVSYQGDRFDVPIDDTDLLDRAARQRAQNESAGAHLISAKKPDGRMGQEPVSPPPGAL